ERAATAPALKCRSNLARACRARQPRASGPANALTPSGDRAGGDRSLPTATTWPHPAPPGARDADLGVPSWTGDGCAPAQATAVQHAPGRSPPVAAYTRRAAQQL